MHKFKYIRYAGSQFLCLRGTCAEIAKLDFPSSSISLSFLILLEVSVAVGKRWMDGKIPQLKGFSIKVI